MTSKKIEIYYSAKSRTIYFMLGNKSFYMTANGYVGQTYGERGIRVGGDGNMENAKFLGNMSQAKLRKLVKALKA